MAGPCDSESIAHPLPFLSPFCAPPCANIQGSPIREHISPEFTLELQSPHPLQRPEEDLTRQHRLPVACFTALGWLACEGAGADGAGAWESARLPGLAAVPRPQFLPRQRTNTNTWQWADYLASDFSILPLACFLSKLLPPLPWGGPSLKHAVVGGGRTRGSQGHADRQGHAAGKSGRWGAGGCWALPEMLRVGQAFLKAALTSGLPSHPPTVPGDPAENL